MSESKDIKSIFESKKIENFQGGNFISSSIDLIAVKYGIKKVVRLECDNLAAYEKTFQELTIHSLKVFRSDEKLFGKYNLYISKSEKLALQAKKTDHSFKIINQNKSFNEVADEIREFGRLLSYPSCCLEKYIENVLNNVTLTQSEIFTNLPKEINFLFNNLLNGLSNYYLSFHFPCSFNCKKTLIYQKRIFDKVKQDSPLFAEALENYLQNPYLVFLDSTLGNMYVSWDNRKGFIFNGVTQNNELLYSQTIYFETQYPDYKKDKTKDMRLSSLSDKIREGNKIIFTKDGFKVLKNKSLLHQFKNRENLRLYLFNFV